MRVFWLLACCVIGLWLTPGAASAMDGPIAIESLGNWPASLTVDQAAALPASAHAPFDQDAAHPAEWHQPLWLHFRLLADHPTAAPGWTLALSRPYVDRAEFYARTAQGTWQRQVAGDWIPHEHWPVHSLNPQFHIPFLQAGVNDFYLRISNETPLHMAIAVQPIDDIQTQNQHTFLLAGLLLGLMALMFVLSCLMALVYRDTTYAWYALYVGLGFFASATYVGISHYAFWPGGRLCARTERWGTDAVIILLMAALTAQTQFCRELFLSSVTSKWVQRGITTILGLNVLAIALYFGPIDLATRQALFIAVNLAHALLVGGIVLHAMRQRSFIVRLWCLGYGPLLLVLTLTVLDTFGWYAVPWLPYNTTLYALIFEMPVLLVALHLHAKAQHTQDVRDSTLAGTDPLTGFVAADFFHDKASRMLRKAKRDHGDVAVAYVEATSDANRPVLHTVRLLRTVVRAKDTVAHVEKNRFAILMPDMSVGEDLSGRLSRLVALGRMTDHDHPDSGPVRFRIVASSLGTYTGTWPALHAELLEKFRQPTGWGQRHIRFVKDHNSEKFENFWQRAVAASAPKPANADPAPSQV
jgi:two-component system, sensor histidine kinase LadS